MGCPTTWRVVTVDATARAKAIATASRDAGAVTDGMIRAVAWALAK